jgi:hypothetical protein
VKKGPPAIDVTIVATRRPALLEPTLTVFQERVFRHFTLSEAFVNIDPIWGDEADERECIEIVQTLLPNATIFTPSTPGFCSAVKRVWTATKADFIFHLEDDWNVTEDIRPSILDSFSDPSIAQVSLVSQQKNWDRKRRGDFHYVKRHPRLFGFLKLPYRKKMTAFTTSPAFTRGEFARRWAFLMNENLDPEKQGYMGVNRPLERYFRPFRNYLYPGKLSEITIVDTGREWREARQIQKKTIEGKSVWTSPNQ